jgi:FAD/FMN-containing dehydrogenase/Fe-S oxidoreductase
MTMTSLKTLREEQEEKRFERLRHDDAKTTFSPARSKELESQLRKEIRGEVRFDNGSRALYATDGSNYRQVPIGLVVPRDAEDVAATVDVCRRFDAPLLCRGGGTSLAGQCCNVAVVMDFSKYMHRVRAIDAERRLGTVEPGCVLDSFRKETARHGLMFAPDPATHSHCTLGGMLGNNSCGIHSLLAAKYGRGLRISDNTHELEILTYDGLRMRVGATSPEEFERIRRGGGRRAEIYGQLRALVEKYADAIRRGFPKLPRRVSGYNLDALLPENNFHVAQALVGSESTLVTILEATLDLVPNPNARSLLVLGYPDVFVAGDHVTDILPLRPTGLEGFDHLLFQWIQIKGTNASELHLLPEGGGHLMVEFGGDSKEDSDAQARHCMEILKKRKHPPTMKLFDDQQEEEHVWKVRESGLSATAWVPGEPDSWPGWEDSAVPPERVGEYLRKLRALFDKFDYHPSLYGHLGQGCIHCRVGFDLYTAEGVEKFRRFMGEAADLVVSLGGALSGEHGDGQARAELLPRMFGETLMQAFREFKSIWDPAWKMNPGKVIDADPITSHLRLGPDYNPPQPATHFQFSKDRHSFARAALRCVGVGKCRREEGGVMCPSYMATREEMHSTRGRARLLFEMLNGEVLSDGWRSKAVREALDLCLSCKGCKGDCPVNVDMATYKAEFLSHFYEGRLRPRAAYSMGLIDWWARMASFLPGMANVMGQMPGVRNVAKWLGGIAQERSLPPFARETFQAWFRRRPLRNTDRPPVVLFPDTFNNYFHPEILKAAVDVLEAAGFRVHVPRQAICSGRPLYDFGMLDLAKQVLRQVLNVLRPSLEADVPVVWLEPSSVSVFRDELVDLFPNDRDAERLKSQSFLLSEFLRRKAGGFRLPQLRRKAIVWGHCHHRSVLDFDDELAVLKDMGLECELLTEGTCCGMAGSFGFEADHYQISQQIGEMSVLPKVREADRDAIVIADGFSCQEQISQGKTGREALHLAQVIQMALREGPQGPARGRLPEIGYPKLRREDIPPSRTSLLAAGLVGLGALVGGFLLWQNGGRASDR